MGKKKKKKQNKKGGYLQELAQVRTKEDMDHQFKKALKEIQRAQISIHEADKKADRKARRRINEKEKDFYTSMEGIKSRKKLSKKWRKTGFLDFLIDLLHTISPLVKMLARAVCTMIIAFMSLDTIKNVISPNTLQKLATIFDIANSV